MFIYEDEALKSVDHVRHGFFGRTGGNSGGLYKSLNVGLGSHDSPEAIQSNRLHIRKILDADKLVTCHQIHSADIVNVGETSGNGPPQADGMVTQHPKTAIGILTADCAPVLAADRKKAVIGAAHAGWGGAFKGIGAHLIKRMIANGAVEKDIIVAIGPCIQRHSYEVGAEFYDCFINQSGQNKQFFMKGERQGHYFFDLPAYLKTQITRAYPKLYHLSSCDDDTYSNEEIFFSYRRSVHHQEPDYGRQMSAISIFKE